MGDMIDRDAAIGALEDRRDKYQKDSQTWLQIQLDILTIRAIPAADARAEALKGAEKALRDWQDSLNVHRMTETAITVGMAADVVAALIADVPRE